jgi:hypothetical protein
MQVSMIVHQRASSPEVTQTARLKDRFDVMRLVDNCWWYWPTEGLCIRLGPGKLGHGANPPVDAYTVAVEKDRNDRDVAPLVWDFG